MFNGTLRFNIDPYEQASEEEIIKILNQAQLQNLLDADPDGLN